MIQAVAEDEERSALGMHYTSVPNILKVLNPLFLDDLRKKLQEASSQSSDSLLSTQDCFSSSLIKSESSCCELKWITCPLAICSACPGIAQATRSTGNKTGRQTLGSQEASIAGL